MTWYGSRVRRQGRSRPWRRNQRSSRRRNSVACAGAERARAGVDLGAMGGEDRGSTRCPATPGRLVRRARCRPPAHQEPLRAHGHRSSRAPPTGRPLVPERDLARRPGVDAGGGPGAQPERGAHLAPPDVHRGLEHRRRQPVHRAAHLRLRGRRHGAAGPVPVHRHDPDLLSGRRDRRVHRARARPGAHRADPGRPDRRPVRRRAGHDAGHRADRRAGEPGPLARRRT